MRIGAFSLDSSVVLLTERLSAPMRIPREDETETMLQASGCCVLNNVKPGIWIAGRFSLLNLPLVTNTMVIWSPKIPVLVVLSLILFTLNRYVFCRSSACSMPSLWPQHMRWWGQLKSTYITGQVSIKFTVCHWILSQFGRWHYLRIHITSEFRNMI